MLERQNIATFLIKMARSKLETSIPKSTIPSQKSQNVLLKIIQQFFRPILNIARYTISFLSKISTLHGTRYLIDKQNKLSSTRILWFTIMLSGVISAVYVIMQFFHRYVERPLVTSIERDYYAWNTTFPSFTLCTQSKMNETELEIYLEEMHSANRNMVKLESFVRALVNLTMYNLHTLSKFTDFESLPHLSVIERLTNKYDYDVLIDSVPRLKLRRTVTELGICDQFNSDLSQFFAPEWLIYDRVPKKRPLFEVNYFDANPHINDLENSNIYLHGPYELPQILHKKEISGSVSQFKSFSLTATAIVARKNVRSLFIKHRKCRYLDESYLNHFPIYTYDLCKLECKIHAIIEKCNCVPFFYKKLPHETHCNIAQLMCVDFHKDFIEDAANSCECYGTCTNVKFSIQGTNTLHWLQSNKLRFELNRPKMRLVREVLHSYSDVIAAIGAVYSLFLGTGILTVAEMFYLGCLHRIVR